jgi:hypothetical protein
MHATLCRGISWNEAILINENGHNENLYPMIGIAKPKYGTCLPEPMILKVGMQ